MILKFYNELCAPCGSLTSLIEKNKIETKNINVMEDTETTQKYNVKAVPVLIKVDDNGSELERATGLLSESELLHFVSS